MIILGTHCSPSKALKMGLKAVHGVNTSRAGLICASMGCGSQVKSKVLKYRHEYKISKICRYVVQHQCGNIEQDIKTLIGLKHHRGVRHMFGLPCRGQRSRTNASTCRYQAWRKGSKRQKKH